VGSHDDDCLQMTKFCKISSCNAKCVGKFTKKHLTKLGALEFPPYNKQV
jgi:hypothetical protein